ncbi:interferon regulatory factor 7 isoform X3 [Scleropages formosus]|uniref:interferon regulatory factor 7 isoform X3 n=1 Tax=Scleropages formosus TaxID=113540 RepID=UPI0008786608|nr:interferon regulatory factor 3 isoform X3 [Scleropages formosus]
MQLKSPAVCLKGKVAALNKACLSHPECVSSSCKPQFAQWLVEQVDSGSYEGLRWVAKDRFRIPWKHNSRKDCSDEDCRIFKEWAVVSGKYFENVSDKAKWKTNFRCALNSLKQFEMVEDRSKESSDPHKVYQIVHSEYKDQNNRDITTNYEHPVIQKIFTDTPVIPLEQGLLSEMDSLNLSTQPTAEQLLWEVSCPMNVHPTEMAYSHQPMHVEPFHPNDVAESVCCPVGQVPVYGAPALPGIQELEISVHYRRKEVLKERVMSHQVQLHYRSEDQAFGAQSICLPGTENIPDRKQAHFTQQILNNLQQGLLLEVRQTGIYGLRQDRCHMYYCSTNPAEIKNPEPNELHRNRAVELLSFDKFIQDLNEFKENRRGSPDYTVYLCFGEKFPDGKLMDKKLVTVKVVPLICRYFHEMAQMDGASSLENGTVSLQFSNSLFDLINSTFGLPSSSSSP